MNFKVVIFVVLSKFLLHSCDDFFHRTEMTRIVGGQLTEIENVAYYASLMENDSFICGGSIISNQWILTAAHCFNVTLTEKNYKIRTGSSRKSRTGQVHQVEKIISHPEYDKIVYSDFDIALIKLKKKMLFSDRQRPIQLANESKTIAGGSEVLISGHGFTNNSMEPTEFLRGVIVNILNLQDCKTREQKNGIVITDNMLCTLMEEDRKGACFGDSGNKFY